MNRKIKFRILPCKTSIVLMTVAWLSALKLQIGQALG